NLGDPGGHVHAPLDHDRGRSALDGVVDEPVAVHLRAAQGEEDATIDDFAGVRVKGREGVSDLGSADLTAPGRLEHLEEAELHTYMRTPIGGRALCASR